MPEKIDMKEFYIALINFTSGILYPLALGLLIPVFMYTLVLEKEEKLLQMMKMNGLKMTNYWIVYLIFNMTYSLVTMTVFMLFGLYISNLSFFTETNPSIMVIFISYIFHCSARYLL
jgi:hypothetical protein